MNKKEIHEISSIIYKIVERLRVLGTDCDPEFTSVYFNLGRIDGMLKAKEVENE